jgi:xanthine dehydrogenase small subunit
MRDHIFFFLNGQKVQVKGRSAFEMLAPFLRRQNNLTGTKIACAHGACGSCSVLLGKPVGDSFAYAPINSCIFPVFGCDGAHIVTVEGLNGPSHLGGQDDGKLSAVQSAMVECHGAQCGFCTPGIVVTLTAFHENNTLEGDLKERVQSALEGNLCRCTGYSPIIEAGSSVDAAFTPLNELYPTPKLLAELSLEAGISAAIGVAADEVEGQQHLFLPRTLQEAVAWKSEHPEAVPIAGATEIGVPMSVKGLAPREILSLARVDGLDEINIGSDAISLGARANWTQVEAAVAQAAPEFAAFLKRWGSPQLRNAGTVAGSLMSALPISDSLPFLLVSEAKLELASTEGNRTLPLADFLADRSQMRPQELARRVIVPLSPSSQLRLFKVSKRRAFDRSIVSAAFLLQASNSKIDHIKIAFGGVASTVLRLPKTEAFLTGKPLEKAIWREAATIAQTEISPISDYAASSDYRTQLVANLIRKFGKEWDQRR